MTLDKVVLLNQGQSWKETKVRTFSCYCPQQLGKEEQQYGELGAGPCACIYSICSSQNERAMRPRVKDISHMPNMV